MNGIKLLLVLSIALCSCQNFKTNSSNSTITSKEKEIAKYLIQGAFDDLWAGVDSTKILKYHTPDFIILEQGSIWDNDKIKEYMRRQLTRVNKTKRINRMDYISVDKYGESIQIAYYNYADFFKGDSLVHKAKWLESALAIKTEKGWRLKMMHSTKVRK